MRSLNETSLASAPSQFAPLVSDPWADFTKFGGFKQPWRHVDGQTALPSDYVKQSSL